MRWLASAFLTNRLIAVSYIAASGIRSFEPATAGLPVHRSNHCATASLSDILTLELKHEAQLLL